MATNDELTRDMVKDVLSHPDVYKMKQFKFGLVSFHPAMFVNVVMFIAMDKIHVKNAALVGEAGYVHNGTNANTLEFGFTSATTLTQKALVLHEATHALLDVIVAPGMKVSDSEAIAYIVQCQYARANNTVVGARLTDTADDKKDLVFRRAWAIAGKILKNKQPKSKDYERLKKAISKHPKYDASHNNNIVWDGV